MSVAHRLGRTEDELAGWSLKRLARWMAYFKIIREEEAKAIESARSKGGKGKPLFQKDGGF